MLGKQPTHVTACCHLQRGQLVGGPQGKPRATSIAETQSLQPVTVAGREARGLAPARPPVDRAGSAGSAGRPPDPTPCARLPPLPTGQAGPSLGRERGLSESSLERTFPCECSRFVKFPNSSPAVVPSESAGTPRLGGLESSGDTGGDGCPSAVSHPLQCSWSPLLHASLPSTSSFPASPVMSCTHPSTHIATISHSAPCSHQHNGRASFWARWIQR